MSTYDHALLHADHRHWQSDVSSWRQDIDAWKKEQAKVLADLRTALDAELHGLEQHGATIFRHGELALQHERLIADVAKTERPAPNEMLARMAETHRQEGEKHEALRSAHDRLKRDHHRAMARLAVVLKALSREA